MGKWNNRSRFHRRRSPLRWYSDRHSSSSSSYGYGEDDGIPIWEKKFCEGIGSVPWQKVVEASTFKSWYHGNVITWNDSACEATFHNEKKRFWSQVNGLHCDISLPDPDLYISEVDWDTSIDPELIQDLERVYFAPPDEVKSGFKRERRDKNWSGFDPLPIEDVPWKGSDKVLDINALEKKSNGWNLSESRTDHIIDRVRPREAKPNCGKEKANDIKSGDSLSNTWETERWRENAGQGNDGWDRSKHQNKKAKGYESVPAKEYEMLDNPWEPKPSCGNETATDAVWGGSSSKGREDRGWGSDCWGSGRWENMDLRNEGMEMKEWRSKEYSRDIREPKGYNPWKVGFVTDSAALREYGTNAGGWQRQRASEAKQRNWDVKRSSDGWGKRNKEQDDLFNDHSNYKNTRYRRDEYQNRKVNFSAK